MSLVMSLTVAREFQMLRSLKARGKRWLSGPSFLAEAFKLTVHLGVFFTSIFFIKFKGVETLDYVLSAPSRVSARMAKGRADNHNLKVIKEAKRISRAQGIKTCESVARSRDQLIKCISDLD